MKLQYSDYFKRKLKKKLRQNPYLKHKISLQLHKLLVDFHHPSLKLHKLKGIRREEYSIWILDNLRITFILLDDLILLTDLISHDEY